MAPLQLTNIRRRKKKQIELLITIMVVINVIPIMYYVLFMMGVILHKIERPRYSKSEKKRLRLKKLNTLIKYSDVICKSRVNRRTFGVICEMARDIGGLTESRNMSIEEIVAMFLFTLAHHIKNRTVGNIFFRSGESVSRNFHRCLLAILKLHDHLLKKPTPITEDCEDGRWKYFKNCLGALDGTYVSVHVANEDRPRYRTRKGSIAMNVLGVCNPNMEFIYVQPGWEGSAHDGRVLRDAISRPHGLKVPQGSYYLVDAGYTNCEGFLAPYRGHRYHLKEWGDRLPISAEEYFNMKHSKARNVIERCFGLLKGRWGILRSPSFFPIRTQGRIVQACVLLHNVIRKYMPTDYTTYFDSENEEESDDEDTDEEMEYITVIATSDAWTNYRNTLAQTLFNNWRARCIANT
ncbi:protein ALP1-like [Spinacia oleracea]|uniref:Protein ALP1-like n=1 Tax=Spinacia oleracea TaxID=3562 RepID=A0ABM3QLT7_SPIOL|nr:protein ALP1-like [Spinacia oleracea]